MNNIPTSRSVRKVILDTIPAWKGLTGRISVHYYEDTKKLHITMNTKSLTSEVSNILDQYGTLKYVNGKNERNTDKIKIAFESHFGRSVTVQHIGHINSGEEVWFKITD